MSRQHILYTRAHQTRQRGGLLRLGFNEVVQFLSKSEVLVSLFKFVFFSPIIILFLQYSHKKSSHVPEMWPIQGLMFNILFQDHSAARSFLWKVGEHAVAGKETLKFGSIFGSLSDFPSLRPQVKRSQVSLFLLCVVSPGSRWTKKLIRQKISNRLTKCQTQVLVFLPICYRCPRIGHINHTTKHYHK